MDLSSRPITYDQNLGFSGARLHSFLSSRGARAAASPRLELAQPHRLDLALGLEPGSSHSRLYPRLELALGFLSQPPLLRSDSAFSSHPPALPLPSPLPAPNTGPVNRLPHPLAVTGLFFSVSRARISLSSPGSHSPLPSSWPKDLRLIYAALLVMWFDFVRSDNVLSTIGSSWLCRSWFCGIYVVLCHVFLDLV
jgi:hypothetical protein